jgi:tartronate-semialdehyde synthase
MWTGLAHGRGLHPRRRFEKLAVGAQFRLPYVHVLVTNSYLGLIRQSQRGFEMDYCVQLAFENQGVEDQAMAQEFRVPVVDEVILEKVTNIAMSTEIEDIGCRHPGGCQGLEMAGLLE